MPQPTNKTSGTCRSWAVFSETDGEDGDEQDPTKESSIVTLIGGGANSALSLRQRAMMSFQTKMSNHSKWKKEDSWLSAQREKQSMGPPLKSQKSKSLLERMAKFTENQSGSNREETWRAKLEERNKKNVAKPSPSHSRTMTPNDGTILTEPIHRESPKMMGSKPSPTLLPIQDSDDEKGHKRRISSSQKMIIERLQNASSEWKKKYRKTQGDATLAALKKKNVSSKQERAKQLELQKAAWRNKVEHTEMVKRVNLNEKVKELESKESEWKRGYNKKSASQELEAQNICIHDVVNGNIDKFLNLAEKEKFDPNAWRKRLQKASNPRHDHLTLLNLQIRKLNSKMGAAIQSEMDRHQTEQYRSADHVASRKDIESIEMAFEERLSVYQTELLNIQSRFEAQIAYYKDLRQEQDSKSFEAMDDEKRKKAQEVMEQQVAQRKAKMANKKQLEEATETMNRSNCFKVLRDLHILCDDDTVINMNNCRVLESLTDSKRVAMKQVLKYCIMDNPRLVSMQFANSKLNDEWFIEDILPAISENAKMLTELLLDSNPLKDASIKELTKYVASNPPCLRVLKFKNLYNDITTEVISEFLKALDSNTQIIKVVMDWRFYDQRDKLQRILDRNWKRYAQERRLKKTLLTQIQNRKNNDTK